MDQKEYKRYNIGDKKFQKNNPEKTTLIFLLSATAVLGGAYEAGKIFHPKKISTQKIPPVPKKNNSEDSILQNALSESEHKKIFYTKKINILEKKLNKIELSINTLPQFLNTFLELKKNYEYLSEEKSDKNIENYIFQKQKKLKTFETSLLNQDKKLTSRAQKIIIDINFDDLGMILASDESYQKKVKNLQDQKNIFEKRKTELKSIFVTKNEIEKTLKILGQKNFEILKSPDFATWQNKYHIVESSLEHQKQLQLQIQNATQAAKKFQAQKISKTNLNNSSNLNLSSDSGVQNSGDSNFSQPKANSSIPKTTPISSPNPSGQKINTTQSSWIIQNNVSPTIKKTNKISQNSNQVNNFGTNNGTNSNGTNIGPKVSSSENFQKIFVIFQPGEGIFHLLKRYKIQPSNILVSEFEKLNGKNLIVGKKYIIPSFWQKKYPLKVGTGTLDTTNPAQNNQKKLIFRALNFLSKNNINIPNYITGDYLMALSKKQGEKNIYKNFSLSDKLRIKRFSKNLDFSSLDSQTGHYAQLAILLASYEKDWKNLNSSLGGLDLQKLTTWSYVGNGWEKMRCIQAAGITGVSSRKDFLVRIFGKDFEQKKVFDKNFGVFYNDIILKTNPEKSFCQLGNQNLTYGDLKNITRYVQLVEAIK